MEDISSEQAIAKRIIAVLKSMPDLDLDKLRAAVETHRHAMEIKSHKFNQRIAAVSAFTALITVSVLVWQGYASIGAQARNELEKRREELKEDVTTYAQQKKDLSGDNIALKGAKLALQNENKDLQDQISAADLKIKSLKQTIESEESRQNNLATEVASLETQKNRLQVQVGTPKETEDLVADLTARLEIASAAHREAMSRGTELQAQLDAARKDINSQVKELSAALAAKDVGLYGPIRKETRRGESFLVGKFKITMINVGNVRRNLDLLIESGGNKKTYSNLDAATPHALDFEGSVFLVTIHNVKQNENSSREEATFTVVVLDKNAARVAGS